MDEEQKYFGMTRIQVGILAGLAGMLILILCVGAFLVFRNLNPAASVPQMASFLQAMAFSRGCASDSITLIHGRSGSVAAAWRSGAERRRTCLGSTTHLRIGALT